MKINIKLNLRGVKQFCQRITESSHSCNFVADSGEFQKNDENQIPTSKNEMLLYPKTPILQSNPSSLKETIKKRYRHILPRPPLQDINQLQFLFNSTTHGSLFDKNIL
ncbi:unnamed protein product [Rhizophagus irregularis]|nr:unnamed protein product [Rhizophagus irregularis]CAB4443490.1 unnamed protein product [Rhizophagus irregularis]